MFNEGVLGWEHIVTIVIGLVLVSFTIWIIAHSYRKTKANQSPLKREIELLKARYARGEINEQEFKERERELMSRPLKD